MGDNQVQISGGYWPNHQSLRDQLSLPLTVGLTPLSKTSTVSSFSGGEVQQYRCHSCKAFINHLCKVQNNQYVCPICGCTNRISRPPPPQSAELTSHVYTCITSNPMNRLIHKHQPIIYTFLLDVSYYGPSSLNHLHYAIHILQHFLHEHQNGSIDVMLMCFDDVLSFYGKDDEGEIAKVVNTHLQEMYFPNAILSLPDDYELVEQVLRDMEEQMENNQAKNKVNRSKAMLAAIHEGFKGCEKRSGRIFLISGINTPLQEFFQPLASEPQNWRDNFTINLKKCFPHKTLKLLASTQCSFNVFVNSSNFVNLLPLYTLTKLTNGVLRLYYPTNHKMFYYQFQQELSLEHPHMGTEAVLRVRHSAGLKLLGVFGQYRPYKQNHQQIELLACTAGRRYVFQFMLEGKIHQPFLNVQFSTLWTDKQGNRIFKVITQQIKITDDKARILSSVNYSHVCETYIQAVLHNMDLNTKTRMLQLTLQERCRKHIQACKYMEGDEGEQLIKAKPYIYLTFLLMRHFLLNVKTQRTRLYDQAIEMRSRILSSSDGLLMIWPTVYAVDTHDHRVIEMRKEEVQQATVGVVANQGDYCHIYLADPFLRQHLYKEEQQGQDLFEVIQSTPSLEPISKVIQELLVQRPVQYLQICLVNNSNTFCIFDESGPLSFHNFIENVLQN